MPQQPLGIAKFEPLGIAKAEPLPTPAAPAPASPLQAAEGIGPAPDSLGGLFREFWHRVNPVEFAKAINQAGAAPLETLKGIGAAQGALLTKAQEAASKGDYLTAGRHFVNYLLPLVGPDLDRAGDKFAEGRPLEGVGASLGIGAANLAPVAIAKVQPSVTVGLKRPLAANPNPAEVAAVAFGERAGIPIDAGTATGSPVVKALQSVAEKTTFLGGRVGQKARQAQADALGRVGHELAEMAYPARAVTPEQAGQAVRDGLSARVREHGKRANQAYSELRAIEESPAQRNTITTTPKEHTPAPGTPDSFSININAGVEELFERAFEDARRQGYQGTKYSLRQEFSKRLESAKSLQEEMRTVGEQYGPKALFQAIRDAGGIWYKPGSKKYGTEHSGGDPYIGEINGLWEASQAGAIQGVGRVLRRDGGKSLDHIAEVLREDPRFRWVEGPNDLLAAMDEALSNTAGTMGPVGLEDALGQTGVRPGTKWWEPTPMPTSTEMPMAVDIRAAKAALEPVAARMRQRLPVAEQRGDPALHAMQQLLDGPDYMRASDVDAYLGAMKDMTRGKAMPDLSDVLAGKAITEVETALRARLTEAGPEAVAALDRGRAATRSKYAAADVLKKVPAEPVQAFKQAIYSKDAGIEHLRAVAKQTPDALPQIGRAFLEDLVQTATAEGGFGRAQGLAGKWANLGPETKQLLFRDEGYIKDLDSFFLLAKKIGENPNPSGTAHTGALVVHGMNGWFFRDPVSSVLYELSGKSIATLMHSRRGVKALTRGFQTKVTAGNKTAATAAAGELMKAAGEGWDLVPLPAGAGSPAGQPATAERQP